MFFPLMAFLASGLMATNVSAQTDDRDVSLRAALPEYREFQIEARGDVDDGYNLPTGTPLSFQSIALNNQNQLAFSIAYISSEDGKAGLWFGKEGQGHIVHRVTPDQLISDPPSLNDQGEIVFEAHDGMSSKGIFRFSDEKVPLERILKRESDIAWATKPKINNDGDVGFLAIHRPGEVSLALKRTKETSLIVSNVEREESSPYSYIFGHEINNKAQISAKMRLGNSGEIDDRQGDEIRLFNPDGTSTLIAEDHDKNPASTFASFDNSIAINDEGWVLFSAYSRALARKSIYLGNGSTMLTIASDDTDGLGKLSAFVATVNVAGLVAFRADDKHGVETLYVSNGQTRVKVISAGDNIATDKGLARIGSLHSKHVFHGSLTMNDHGNIAFRCNLISLDGKTSLGSGVFVAYATIRD